jgi:uncharacterized damage-inducible protein DinB
MDARQLLVDTHAHLPPASTLAAIVPHDAVRRVGELPHSIADIVAHMTYWQEWFTARCEGRDEAMPSSAAVGWPAVTGDEWPALADRFVAGLDRLAQVVAQHPPDAPITPALEPRMLAGYSFRDAWEHVAQHNAHHLGQVVVLRQLLGIWPPPSGSYTW